MKPLDVIAAGVKPLAQNRLRAGLSVLGIFIGIAGVLCMIAIGDGAKKIIAEDIEKLGGSNQFTLWTRMSTFFDGINLSVFVWRGAWYRRRLGCGARDVKACGADCVGCRGVAHCVILTVDTDFCYLLDFHGRGFRCLSCDAGGAAFTY